MARIVEQTQVVVRAQEAVVVSTHDTEIVSALRLAIAEHVGPDRFDLWFAGTELTVGEEYIRVISANQFQLEWVRKNLRSQIEAACHSVLGRSPVIEFSFGANTGGTARNPVRRSASESADLNQPLSSIGEAAVVPAPPTESKKSVVLSSAKSSSPAKTVSSRKFRSLSTFVVGESNRLAFTAAEMVLRDIGRVSPLCIHGPTGVGKSHLLEGIWTAVRRGPERRRCVYLTAEQFTSYFLESLHGRGLPSFRRRYRDLDLLIIEDVQFLMGKTATLTEFQFTVDTLLREGKQLVFSADRNPSALSRLGPEVMTRLAGGLVAYLPPPDRELRLQILAAMAKERHMPIDGDVLALIADNLTEDVRVLAGALNRLWAASMAAKLPITMQLATKTLDELFLSNCCAVQLDDIQRVVCDVFGVDSRELRSNTRTRQMTHPRMLAMWLARKHTRAVLSEIGEYFGNRSHSTVISAEKRVNNWVSAGTVVRLPDCDCRVEEAIRRIETKLRAS